MTKKVSDLLNEQFYNELYAAHLYFAISACMRLTPYQGVQMDANPGARGNRPR